MSFQPADRAASIRSRLNAFPFFQSLEENDRAHLESIAMAKHFVDVTSIVRPGEECPAVPLVERGAVRVLRESSKDLLLYDVTPGDACVLALTSVLREEPYPAKAVALAETDAILIPSDEARLLFARAPALQQYVVKLFAQRFEDLMDLAHDVAFESVDKRLCDLLFREASHDTGVITLSHAELASMLGTAREVVSRSLDKLQKAGLVQLGRRRIEVPDPRALLQIT